MISDFERSVNEICALLGFYAALIGSFLPTFCENSGCEILTAVLVKIQVIKDVSPFRLVKLPSSSGSTVQNALRSTETSITLHHSTGRDFHQHLCENVMSLRIEDRAGPSYCVLHVIYGSVKIIATFTKALYWTYFFHSVHYDILKLWLTPISAQF